MAAGQTILLLIAYLLLAVSTSIVFFQPSAEMNGDLGRHLLLGRLIWNEGSVPRNNLLSYTYPDFPFINHHWLSEVLMYLTSRSFGLDSLIVMKSCTLAVAFAVSVWLGMRSGGVRPALFGATFLLPLMLERNSERPEMFALPLFSALLLLLFPDERRKRRAGVLALGGGARANEIQESIRFTCVGAILALWVNLHISFVYGLLLVCLSCLEQVTAAIARRNGVIRLGATLRHAALLLGISLAATLLNPNGPRGALYPFLVFRNFGYETVENVGVLRLLGVLREDFCLPYFLVCAPMLGALLVLARKEGMPWTPLHSLSIVFAILTFLKVRNMPYFVLSAIPACSSAIQVLGRSPLAKARALLRASTPALILCHLAFSTFLLWRMPPALVVPEPGRRGFDLFVLHSPPGHVFNNFDIGSYLEYRLYPNYRSFVDNRPEAFPAQFFSTYIRMQTDPAFRREKFSEYRIGSVIFSRTDMTDWGKKFLADIQADPAWITIYADEFLLILEPNVITSSSTR